MGLPATDDWNKFDIPSLRGIGKTAPYFHNNSAATLEEVVDNYTAFFKRVQTNLVPNAKLPPVAAALDSPGQHTSYMIATALATGNGEAMLLFGWSQASAAKATESAPILAPGG